MSALKSQVQIVRFCKLSFYKCQGRGPTPWMWAGHSGHQQIISLGFLTTALQFGTKVLLPYNIKADENLHYTWGFCRKWDTVFTKCILLCTAEEKLNCKLLQIKFHLIAPFLHSFSWIIILTLLTVMTFYFYVLSTKQSRNRLYVKCCYFSYKIIPKHTQLRQKPWIHGQTPTHILNSSCCWHHCEQVRPFKEKYNRIMLYGI